MAVGGWRKAKHRGFATARGRHWWRRVQRSPLQLDDDVLPAARVLSLQKRTSLGAVIRALVRQALVGPAESGSGSRAGAEGDHRNGVTRLPWKAEGAPVHHEQAHRWFAASPAAG